MASEHERFWERESFAVVGHAAKKAFPKLTYRGLKKSGKKVFPVDPGGQAVDGDETYPDLASLPQKVDAVVLELPPDETKDWVAQAADAGIDAVWIHMNSETDEALALAEEKGIKPLTGTCAVMYVTPGVTFHSIHKWINKLLGKY